jgi:hypothetical protein
MTIVTTLPEREDKEKQKRIEENENKKGVNRKGKENML